MHATFTQSHGEQITVRGKGETPHLIKVSEIINKCEKSFIINAHDQSLLAIPL